MTDQRKRDQWRIAGRKYWYSHIEKNRERCRNYQRKRRLKLKLLVIDLLGGRCQKCGFTDRRTLQIDHINGGGGKELKIVQVRWGRVRYLQSILSMQNPEIKYQLLCANCNWIKVFEKKESNSKYDGIPSRK